MSSLAKPTSPRARAAYLLTVLLGSYAVIWTFTGFLAAVLSGLGLVRSEAVLVSSLLAFVLYPVLVLVTLAARRPLRLWSSLAVASLLLRMAASWGTS